MYSIDQGGQPIEASSASFEGGALKFAVEMIGGNYEGKMSADGKSIAGTWTQGPKPLPSVLERATPETAWAIPAPMPKMPPMAANADPSFEVATIKPSKPGQQGKGFGFRGRQFITMNTNLKSTSSPSPMAYMPSRLWGHRPGSIPICTTSRECRMRPVVPMRSSRES